MSYIEHWCSKKCMQCPGSPNREGGGLLRRLLGWFEEGALRPVISETMPLERAAVAMQRLLRREAKGKIVLTTAD